MDTPDTYWDLFFGYSAIWIIIAFYLFALIREQSNLQKRMDEIGGAAGRFAHT